MWVDMRHINNKQILPKIPKVDETPRMFQGTQVKENRFTSTTLRETDDSFIAINRFSNCVTVVVLPVLSYLS